MTTTTDEQETPVSPPEDNNDLVSEVKARRAEMEQMKERFAKLLLGEDMSGGGKGVSSALALSNAITNLAENLQLLCLGSNINLLRCRTCAISEESSARWC